MLLIRRIRIDPSVSISIEKFDDIAFHDRHQIPFDLIQTKHHINAKGNLGNASVDLWRTIKVWIDQYRSGAIVPANTIFSILTTAKALEDSSAFLLREDDRQPDVAVKSLLETANNSTSKENYGAYKDFKGLNDQERFDLVNSIYVVDCSPKISDVEDELKRQLVTNVRSDFIDSYLKRLEGWWFQKCIDHLTSAQQIPIPGKLLVEHMVDLAEQFHCDSLPIDEILCDPPTDADATNDQREFVKALRQIACNSTTIKHAIQDFYRAFEQRGRWVRDELLLDKELDRYEERLVEEWQRFHNRIVESLPASASLTEKEAAGRSVYYWSQDSSIYIRPRCTEPFVVRGSFHMLSNNGRVGWHPDFIERVRHTLASVGET